MTRNINDAGLALIKSHEGCILTPYKDIGGVLTIGYGHTRGVTIDSLPLTQDQAEALLLADIEPFEDAVDDMDVDLTDNQFAALVSLCFNVGTAPLHMTLGDYLNSGDFEKAADEFLKWNHCGGLVIKGLTERRIDERELFLKTDNV